MFSCYGEAGLVQLRFMRIEDQEEWAKLVSIQQIDMHQSTLDGLLNLCIWLFSISFMDYMKSEEL